MIYVCERCDIEVDDIQRPDQCTVVIAYGVLLGYVSADMASDAGEPDMEGQPIFGDSEPDICGGQFYMLGDL